MKRNNFLFVIASIMFIAFTFTSCTEDKVGPEVKFGSGVGFISADSQVEAESEFKVQVKGAKGDVNMTTLTIYENGTKLALERIVDGLNANPALLLGADAEAFSKEITITAQSLGTSDYLFVLEDENLLKDTVELVLTLNPQTFFNLNKPGLILYNADGPTDYYGSIDLQKGESVPSISTDGDVQDLGIEATSTNWEKKIVPENGTLMALPSTTIDYDKMKTLENLILAFDAGTATTEELVTVGKIFLLKSPSKVSGKFDYFIMKTLEVNETTTDNKDYYKFALKGYVN